VTVGAFQSTGSTAARQCSEVVVDILERSGTSEGAKLLPLLLLRLHSAEEEKCREG